MTVRGWLDERLQIAVGPLPEWAVVPHRAARLERRAQVRDQALPVRIGERPVELDGPSDADRQAHERLRRWPSGLVQ